MNEKPVWKKIGLKKVHACKEYKYIKGEQFAKILRLLCTKNERRPTSCTDAARATSTVNYISFKIQKYPLTCILKLITLNISFHVFLHWKHPLRGSIIFFPFVVKNQKNACRIRPTSAISDTHYLELSLCRTFCLVSSTFSINSPINPLGISNSSILNFHYVKQFSRSLQWFLGCFPSAIWNIWMRFSNESYSSFQAFEC